MMISAVITTRNRASLLPQAIESVLRQEPCGVEVELIVVDDGSTDDTAAVVASYPSARYVPTRQGTSAGSRNVGLEHAQGEWIAFLDDDDVWLPNKLLKCVEVIDAHPRARLVFSAAAICGYNLRRQWVFKGPNLPNYRTPYDAFLDHIPLPSTVLVHREIFDKLGGFDTSLGWADDREMWLRIASDGFECASAADELVLYRVDDAVFRWKQEGERLARQRYAATMKVLRRYFAPGMTMRPSWRRRQQVLWRVRGWYAYQFIEAAKQAQTEKRRSLAWRLRRSAFAISPVHAVKNWLSA